MDQLEDQDEIRIPAEAPRQADRDRVASELDEGDGEGTFLGEGSTYERIELSVDAAIAAIEDGGLKRETTAKRTLALPESILLTTYVGHLGIIEASVRMTHAA